jgi:F-type H+-transporting ATPase subunit a
MRVSVHQRNDVNLAEHLLSATLSNSDTSMTDITKLGLAQVLTSHQGRDLFKLKIIAVPFFVVAVFIGISADLTWAVMAEAQITPAISQAADTASPETKEHGLSTKAVEIARPFNFPITNSMVVSWIVAVSLILFAQLATRSMKQVPTGAQNFLEWLVEGLYKFMVGIIGPHLAKRTFWFFATIFIFILSANWIGLIPGVGAVGWGHRTNHGFVIDQPLFRGANADVNMTLAMALVFFASWIVWAVREVGVMGFLKELFAPKGESKGVLKLLMVVVFFAAGCLEVVSILFRPVSLSFRLYGNIFAGENLLEAMSKLVPGFGWLVSIPFYFLELVMGLVQALVFMLLTAVFTMLICQHETEGPVAAHG